jgi:hypothetical protein
MSGIKVSVHHGEAFDVTADVMILKYGPSSYGLEKVVEREFLRSGNPVSDQLPTSPGQHFYTDSKQVTKTKGVLFIGVPALEDFGYQEIREYGKTAMATLANAAPSATSLVMTIQGPRLGLDDHEAFSCQIAGMLDSIAANQYPPLLKEIIFVERSAPTAAVLKTLIADLFPSGSIAITAANNPADTNETLKSVGARSEQKKVVFVAMPFAAAFDDCYHYGIQGAVHASGYLCERADLNSFTGDVMEFVKERIASSDFVIADLSTANPNVYLEVGYAWGLNKKTVLVIRDPNELAFDTRGQRCLHYSTIKDLENKLKNEIATLKL